MTRRLFKCLKLRLKLTNFFSTQVNIPTTAGDLGILADHVPTIQQLRPGVIEVINGSTTEKYFVSGGFATVNEGSALNINAVDAHPVEDFSPEVSLPLLNNPVII